MTEDDKRADGSRAKDSALRPAQVTAAALAAVTAAFLGSTLGVYGTVLGAGLISVVTTLGSELYIRSLDRTKAAARGLSGPRARRGRGTTGADADRDADAATPAVASPVPKRDPVPRPEGTPGGPEPGRRSGGSGRAWWKRRGPLLVATSAVAFVIGMLAVTGYEGATGRALSGDDGTTVGDLFGGRGAEPAPGGPAGTDDGGPGTDRDGDAERDRREGDRDGDDAPTRTSTPTTSAPGEPEESRRPDRTDTPTETETPPRTSEPAPAPGEPEPTGGGDQPGADDADQGADDPVGE